MARPKHTMLEYRNYELPPDFPILVLTGERWHISPVPGIDMSTSASRSAPFFTSSKQMKRTRTGRPESASLTWIRGFQSVS